MGCGSVLVFFWFVASPPCGSLCAIIVHMIPQPPGPPVCLFFLFLQYFPAFAFHIFVFFLQNSLKQHFLHLLVTLVSFFAFLPKGGFPGA